MQRRSEDVRSRSGDTDDKWKGEASKCRGGPKAFKVENGDTDDRSKGDASRCRGGQKPCAVESSDTDDR